jgi:membrane-bound serine protease (ClpP class)
VRRLSTVGGVLVALAVTLGAAAAAGAAPSGPSRGTQEQPERRADRLSVVKVSGLLDPILADFVDRAITDAERADALWLVLHVNSSATRSSGTTLAELVERVATADVPVAVWVGPSGARAEGGTAQLAGAADRLGVAPGSRIGRTGEPVVDPVRFNPDFAGLLDRLRDGTVDAREAQRLGLTERPAPVIGDFIVTLDGVQTKVVRVDGRPRRTVSDDSVAVFGALPIGDQLLHTVASPAVAYLLFVIGMALIVFELFTAGVGVAGLVGAGCFVLGCYGLAVLPTRPAAVALLVVAMVAFAVDVQTGVPRVWTGVATACLIVGSFLLYDGLSLSWITLLVALVGIGLFMLAGMPAMVRARFSTPTIGRSWMVGEEGEAVAEVAPDGVVRVRGALWRARTNRATPINAGAPVRVVEVDGLLLEVEPTEGGAVDYRERRS